MRRLLFIILAMTAMGACGRADDHPYRNAYLSGTMPWHRSFRDVNLCTGNLMKSFTDIQVAPARGAGLVLQRTYNSNDGRIGPFGRGWGHAYDIRTEEALTIEDDLPAEYGVSKEDHSIRTDFFGGKHAYKRDADGLYTPPPYMHDWAKSDYKAVLETGPGDVNSDTDIGLDGTEKHFFLQGNVRLCDYIKDRHGNYTELQYETGTDRIDMVIVRADPQIAPGTGLASEDRLLEFTWTNFGTQQDPIYRITDVVFRLYYPLTALQSAHYDYYLPEDYNNILPPEAGGEWYNLKAVHLDPNGLNRTTTYTYTSVAGQNGTEYGLLASVTDPLGQTEAGHTVSYEYDLDMNGQNWTGTAWASQITEPGGVTETNPPQLRSVVWELFLDAGYGHRFAMFSNSVNDPGEPLLAVWVQSDELCRQIEVGTNSFSHVYPLWGYSTTYDDNNNVTSTRRRVWGFFEDSSSYELSFVRQDNYTYGRFGNVLTHWIGPNPRPQTGPFSDVESYAYYPEEKYFQKAGVTDMAGNVTTFDYGLINGTAGERGNLLWVRDALHQPDGTAFAYTYNNYGQKLSEANLNNVVTQYTYGDNWGNLTQVVQDPGQGLLNRTTKMEYDEAGRVIHRWDPNNSGYYPNQAYAATVDYNVVGQPETATFPAPNAETVSYTYGDNGRLESVTDGRGTTSLAYEDGCDRVSSVTDPVTGPVSYTYFTRGSMKTKTLPDGHVWRYNYKNDGSGLWSYYWNVRIASDDPNANYDELCDIYEEVGGVERKVYVHDYIGTNDFVHSESYNRSYDGNNNLISYCSTDYYNDGVKFDPYDEMTWHTHGWLRKVVNKFHWKDGYGVWQEKVLCKNQYTYDDVGNRLTNAVYGENNVLLRTEEYNYDDLNRLTSVDYGDNETQAYTFDDMGNRLTLNGTQYQYNAANMLRWRGNNEYTYDANGNNLTGGGRTNTWDSQNRLRQCVYGNDTSTFTYGSDELRRSMTVNSGQTTYYLLDGQNVAQEGHLNEYNNFVPDVTYLSGPRGVEYRLDESTGQVRWYLYDGLGSVVAEVDENGYITATQKYDVYGAVRGETGTPIGDQKFVGSLGHITEDESGLIYMRARYFNPLLGRFISEDPAGDSINWFAYCTNNPVNLTDSTGMIAGFDDSLNEDAEWGIQAVKTGKNITWNLNRIFDVVRQATGISRRAFGDIIEQEIKGSLDMLGSDNIGLVTKGKNAGHLLTKTGQDLGHFIDWFTRGY